MKIIYFDCSSGISGDMTLAALTDLGVPHKYLKDELTKLNIDGLSVLFGRTEKNGISANFADVSISCETEDHRHYNDIIKLIDDSTITEGAKIIAKDIFKVIGEAEARVHGTCLENVHFHEVGAWDSIADVVGTAICIDYLKPDRILSAPVNDGYGFSYCSHGKIPVPVPAVMEIFGSKGVVLNQIDIESELVTPTGAGIIATLAEQFTVIKNMTIIKTGYGAGKKDLNIPNVLRVHLCVSAENSDSVTVIETNIDDQTPETLSFAMDRLMEAGAADVFFTPIQMKKNRPAVLLTVICHNKDVKKMADIIFLNTSTFGIRHYETERITLDRYAHTVCTPYGDIGVKVGQCGNIKKMSPEYESAKKAALASGVSVEEIYKSVYKYEL